MSHVFDAAVKDATGNYFINQLERLDPVLNKPLASFTYARDVDFSALDLADETTAFEAVSYAASSMGNAPAFISDKQTEFGVSGVEYSKKVNPTFLWGMSIQKSIIELERAMKLGRDLSADLFDALNMRQNVDLQNLVYKGNAASGTTGLINDATVTAAAVSGAVWASKTPDQILNDINTVLDAAWAASGYTSCPSRIGLPPTQFSRLASTPRASGSDMSIAKWLSENSLANSLNGAPLEIVPMRELVGAGAGATDRMIAYRKDSNAVRFPKSAVRALPVETLGMFQRAIYVARVGVIEFKQPELARYADGI